MKLIIVLLFILSILNFGINAYKVQQPTYSPVIRFIYVRFYGQDSNCLSSTGEEVVDTNTCAYLNNNPSVIRLSNNEQQASVYTFDQDDYLCSESSGNKTNTFTNHCFELCQSGNGCTFTTISVTNQPTLNK